MFVKRVLHPISMKHPNQFLIGSIGDRSGASFAVSYFSIEFRIDGRWVPAEILFDHRIAELEALM